MLGTEEATQENNTVTHCTIEVSVGVKIKSIALISGWSLGFLQAPVCRSRDTPMVNREAWGFLFFNGRRPAPVRKALIPSSSAWKVSGTPGDLRRHHGCHGATVCTGKSGTCNQMLLSLPPATVGSSDGVSSPPRLPSLPLTWRKRPPTPVLPTGSVMCAAQADAAWATGGPLSSPATATETKGTGAQHTDTSYR